MTGNEIVLFGNGQMAETAHVYFQHDSPFSVVAFCVDRERITGVTFRGLPLVAFEDLQKFYPPKKYRMFIPMSAKNSNSQRENKFIEAKKMGYTMISFVSSQAMIAPETSIGENCFIFEANVIQPFASIGDNTILWSGNHIGHHSSIGDHCFLASHVVISGRVSVGNNCYFGVNSTVRDGIEIAASTTVGAGALIMKNTEAKQVYMGAPGRRVPQKSDDVDII